MASRLSYECLCGDVSQSVASWRGVPMLLVTMQRLVAMRARDLSSYLVTHLAWLCPMRALATQNCRQMLSQSIAVYCCGNAALQPSVSCESRRSKRLRRPKRERFEPPTSVGVRSFTRALEALPVPLEKGKQRIDSKCGAAEQVWMGSRAGA